MRLTKTVNLTQGLLLTGLLLAVSLIFNSHATHAATITVDSKADTAVQDDGQCTLREAIANANDNTDTTDGGAGGDCTPGDASPTVDTIDFNITGTADYSIRGQSGYTIEATTQLTAITEVVTIDGYTQPGASHNTNLVGQPFNGVVLVSIDSANAGATYGAFVITASPNVTISGFSLINATDGGGIAALSGSDNCRLNGNLIGIKPDGTIAKNTSSGIGIVDSSGCVIGGPDAADRNVITASGGSGIGEIYVGAGGGTPTSNTVIQGNYVGTDIGGVYSPTLFTDHGVGINLSAGTSQGLVGGTGSQDANIIVNSGGAGIVITQMLSPLNTLDISAANYAILGNQIFGTTVNSFLSTSDSLGIDLVVLHDDDGDFAPDRFDTGPNLNDVGDIDASANNSINYPVLNSVSQSDNTAIINYSLDAADSPSDSYRVEFFGNDEADPSGYGEGQTFLGAITSSNGTNQQTAITLPSGYNLAGKFITATTTAVDNTKPAGFGSTSEFSKNIQVASDLNSGLASTGQNIKLFVIAAIGLVGASGAVLIARNRKK